MENIEFKSSPRGNVYISVSYHQKNGGGRPHKSKWSIEPNEEFDLFCLADIVDCPEKADCPIVKTCEKANDCPKRRDRRWMSDRFLFSFRNKSLDVIGKKGERIARFEGNDTLKKWHGYPIFRPVIDKDLINYWRENDLITDAIKKKLIKHKV